MALLDMVVVEVGVVGEAGFLLGLILQTAVVLVQLLVESEELAEIKKDTMVILAQLHSQIQEAAVEAAVEAGHKGETHLLNLQVLAEMVAMAVQE
jgi:hypothetical protein